MWLEQLESVISARAADKRLPMIVLLGQTAQCALHNYLLSLKPEQIGSLVVFAAQNKPDDWPLALRYVQVPDGDLVGPGGCLCCSMNAQFPSMLSHLFLRILRREEPATKAVILVTAAESAAPIEATLRHAPFLRQRYRLAACLPPVLG